MQRNRLFGPFVLDSHARKLTVFGATVPLTAKPLAILEQLLAAEGDIVTRDQLMAAVWPNEFAGEATLSQHVHVLRDALRQYSRGGPDIVTVPKMGYRIAVPPTPSQQPRNAVASPNYLKGRFHLERRTEADFDKAIACFEAVLAVEPEHVEAYVGIAEALILLGSYICREPNEVYPKARTLLQKAIELQPALGIAYAHLAGISFCYDRDIDAALELYDRALTIDPQNASVLSYRFWLYIAMGRMEMAMADLQAAISMQPYSPRLWTCLGVAHLYREEYEEAETHLRAAIEIDDSHYLPTYHLCAVKGLKKDYESVLELAQKPAPPEFDQHIGALQGYAYAKLGDRARAQRRLAEILATPKPSYPSGHDVAVVHVGLGDHDAAIDALEQSLERNEPRAVYVEQMPYFKALRNDVRFKALCTRVFDKSCE